MTGLLAVATFLLAVLTIVVILGAPQSRPRSASDLPAPAGNVLALIKAGEKVAAIRAYRRQTGATLLEASRVVAHHAT